MNTCLRIAPAYSRLGLFLACSLAAACGEEFVEIGSHDPHDGGGWTFNVSNEFTRSEMEQVYGRVQLLRAQGEFNQFACGDTIPGFRYHMTLKPAAEYRERLVSVGYSPGLKSAGEERCLSSGLFYLLERTFNEVDWGPPVDYGYTNPRTGMPLVAEKSVPRKPVCRCDLRHSGREWVVYSDKGARELQ